MSHENVVDMQHLQLQESGDANDNEGQQQGAEEQVEGLVQQEQAAGVDDEAEEQEEHEEQVAEMKPPIKGVSGEIDVAQLPGCAAGDALSSFLIDTVHPLYTQAMDHLRKEPEETRPYDHMYACRDELKEVKAKLDEAKATIPDLSDEQLNFVDDAHHRLDNIVGALHVDTDETSEGCTLLTKVAEVEDELPPHIATPVFDARNRLAIVWAERKEFARALDMLQRGRTLYYELKQREIVPWGRCELLPVMTEEERVQELESTYTHCLFYLAQCYMQLDQPGKSAEYCQQTLARQYETGQFDKLEWAINAAAISQYYLSECAYEDARAYLATAQAVADTEERTDEDAQQKVAAIAQCWVKYHTTLLEVSWELLQGNVQREDVVSALEPPLRIPVPKMQAYIAQTPVDFAATSSEARKFFLQGQKWLQRAMQYYTLNDHASGHVACVQDCSVLYKRLAAFEQNPDTAAKMHKRRADMLENTLNELNPQYYLAVCKQLAFELGNVFQDMMDLKLAKLKPDTPDAKLVTKIYRLGHMSITYFQRFIDFHCDRKGDLPQTYEEGVAKGVMTAHFTIARIYSKLITPDRAERVKNLEQSLRYHKYIVDYCETHPDFTEFQKEVELSKEMVQLLPAQIQRV